MISQRLSARKCDSGDNEAPTRGGHVKSDDQDPSRRDPPRFGLVRVQALAGHADHLIHGARGNEEALRSCGCITMVRRSRRRTETLECWAVVAFSSGPLACQPIPAGDGEA